MVGVIYLHSMAGKAVLSMAWYGLAKLGRLGQVR